MVYNCEGCGVPLKAGTQHMNCKGKQTQDYEVVVKVTYRCVGDKSDVRHSIDGCFDWRPEGAGHSKKTGAHYWRYEKHEFIDSN